MRVEIIRLLDVEEGRVVFRSELGQAPGYWAGPNPARLGEFDVELEIPEVIDRWAVLETPSPGSIEGDGEVGVSITGRVVTVGEGDDPVVGIRVGSDVVLVEAPDRKGEIIPGDVVSLAVSRILIYPYRL